jgi:hypothetical protein
MAGVYSAVIRGFSRGARNLANTAQGARPLAVELTSVRTVAAWFGAPVRALLRVIERARERRRLADSARRFSLRTGAMVDEHLSFAATLVRAGEVRAARRLIEEVEHDVRLEGDALVRRIEQLAGSATTGTANRSGRLSTARSGWSLPPFPRRGSPAQRGRSRPRR